jgi:hypothetical protein
MRIYNNSRRNLKPRPEHDIPRLPSHPRQPKNLLHGLRNLAPKLLDHNPRRALNRLRLIPKKSCSPNQLLQLRQRSRSHSLRSRERLEQRWSDKIHPNIRALRRQNRRHRQLPRIPVIQRTNHSRISLPQDVENRRNPLRCQRIARPPSFLLRRNRLRSCNRPSLHSWGRIYFRRNTDRPIPFVGVQSPLECVYEKLPAFHRESQDENDIAARLLLRFRLCTHLRKYGPQQLHRVIPLWSHPDVRSQTFFRRPQALNSVQALVRVPALILPLANLVLGRPERRLQP